VPLHGGSFRVLDLVIECRGELLGDLVAGEGRRLAELDVKAHAEGVRGGAARALAEVLAGATLRGRCELSV
jgi:hypothetical protein